MKKIYFKGLKYFFYRQNVKEGTRYVGTLDLEEANPISEICVCRKQYKNDHMPYYINGSGIFLEQKELFETYHLFSIEEALKRVPKTIHEGSCFWEGYILHKMMYRTLVHSIDPTINVEKHIKKAYFALQTFCINEGKAYFHSTNAPLRSCFKYDPNDKMICWEKRSYGLYYDEAYYTIRFHELAGKLAQIKDPETHFIEGFIYNGEYFKDRFDDVFDCEELFYIFKHAKDYTLYY